MPGKYQVLFLCTGNSCRSQMAEAFLRHYAGEGYEVFSAGLALQPIHPLTMQVMAEVGLDISGQLKKTEPIRGSGLDNSRFRDFRA